MKCHHCDKRPAVTSYWSVGFVWDHICTHCKERMKLDDWNRACRPLEEKENAIHQTE